jgi:hypothetical protein
MVAPAALPGGISLFAAVSLLILSIRVAMAEIILVLPGHPETPETPAVLAIQHLPLASILRGETLEQAAGLVAVAEMMAIPAIPAIRAIMLIPRFNLCPPVREGVEAAPAVVRVIREAVTAPIQLPLPGLAVLAVPAVFSVAMADPVAVTKVLGLRAVAPLVAPALAAAAAPF